MDTKAFSAENLSRRDMVMLLLVVVAVVVGSWNTWAGIVLSLVALGLWRWAVPSADRVATRWSFSWMDAALLGMILAELLSYGGSVYRPNSLFAGERLAQFALLFYGFRLLLPSPEAKQLFWGALAAYALFLGVGALLSFNSFSTNLWLEGWPDASQFKGSFAPFGLLNNEWASISLVMLPLPLCVVWMLRSQRLLWLGGVVALVFINWSVLITFSRGAYLTLGFCWLIAFVGLLTFRLLPLKHLTVAAAVVGLLSIAAAIPIWKPVAVTLSMNQTISQQRSTQGRFEIISNSLCQLQGHWVTGLGSNNYPLVNDLCRPLEEEVGYSGFSNSSYLQLFMEKGLVGLVAYLLFFGLMAWYAFQHLRRSTSDWESIMYLCCLVGLLTLAAREVFFSTLLYSKLVWTFAAVYAGFIASGRPRNDTAKSSYGWMAALGLLLLWTAWIAYEQRRLSQTVQIAFGALEQRQKPQVALRMAQEAIEQAPQSAPLYEVAALITAQNTQKLSALRQAGWAVDRRAIAKAQVLFEQAYQANPLDAATQNNLGWVFFLQGRLDKALPYVEQALVHEPNNTEFWLSKALFLEKTDSLGAMNCYATIVRRDPEFLGSEWMRELESKAPGTTQRLAQQAADTLRAVLGRDHNTILVARLGALEAQAGHPKEAKRLLTQAVSEIPSLIRPYYNLAQLALQEQDTTKAAALLQKSFFLLPQDYLPLFSLANINYHRRAQGKPFAQSSVRYYRQALQSLLKASPSHRGIIRFKYQSYLGGINDLLIKDLLFSSRTAIDLPQIANRMVELFTQLQKPELAAHYRSLAQRELISLGVDDIK